MRPRAVYQLTLAKVREILREPEALFWVFVFPVLMALVLGIAFRSRGPEPVRVAVIEAAGADAIVRALEGSDDLVIERQSEERARVALSRGAVGVAIEPGDPPVFHFDPSRPESRLARIVASDAIERAAGRADRVGVEQRVVDERGSRYIDFLVPGLLGLNLMGTGIWGIAFSIVQARSKGVLKRLTATPMRKAELLIAQVLGRMLFLPPEVVVVLGFGAVAFGVPFRGSALDVALVVVLGAFAFSGLGLLTASRARTVEGVSGLINVVLLPMWLASGVFFSTERFPEAARPWIDLLPLTALNDALRAILLDGRGLATLGPEVANLGVWSVASFAAALGVFRWR